jgi:uncharacterized membrane protein YhaH (DUF805 family)
VIFPLNYIFALITPSGRISQFPFAILVVGLAFANLWVYNEAVHAKNGLGETYMAVLFALIWMKFCIMSRRMHDTGSTGAILVPFLLISIAIFLMSYDPSLVGATREAADKFSMVIEHGTKGVRVLFVAILLYLLRAPSESGPNAYGPEWGEEEFEKADQKQAKSGRAVSTAPASASASSRAARNALSRLEALEQRPRPRAVAPEPAVAPVRRAAPAAAPAGGARRQFARRG